MIYYGNIIKEKTLYSGTEFFMKITFMGAGSTVFVRNVIGDSLCSEVLRDSVFALYDIDAERLNQSRVLLEAIQKTTGGHGKIECYLGVENRKEALRGADFIINAIQVALYDPGTKIDFAIPKKYGLRQTIGDTLGIGGIMRALRTIPVMADFARDIEEVCPDALFLNYTNPMAMLTGFMNRYTGVKTVGLCHSVQVCTKHLLTLVGMEDKLEGRKELIAGINHMGWLLEIRDLDGNDLYPLIRERAKFMNENYIHHDMTRYEYINRFGYYCTESSEHNAEYNPYFIKSAYPELIQRYNIPLDEYPRRCVHQIARWKHQKEVIFNGGNITHRRSREYASRIIEAMTTNVPFKIGGNVLNRGLITNLPHNACVEVPCLVDAMGIHPTVIGDLPEQLAAMNRTNINPQLLTIQAARTRKREDIYMAAMLDPHTSAELSIDDIVSMCDDLIEAHQAVGFMTEYK